MKDNFDFIKNKFESENIETPASLNENNIKSMLESGTQPKNNIKLRSNKPFKSVVALVACLAVFIVSVVSVNALNNKPNISVAESTDSALITYSDYSEIEKQIKSLEKDRFSLFNYGLTMKGDSNMDIATEGSLESTTTSYSETNIQVEGVDEADIVKTDGKYIYRFSIDETAVKIFEVNGRDVKALGRAELVDNHDYIYMYEMYLTDNKLVTIGLYGDYDEKEQASTSGTVATVFNIDDKSNPTVEYTYEQSGSYTSSRMIGNILYLVTDHYAESNNYIPKSNGNNIPCDCIYGVAEIDEPSFVVVSAVDVENQNANKVKTKAILGGANQIYCSNENLYVVATNYRWYNMLNAEERQNQKTTSDIIKISLDKTNLDIVATGQIVGQINDQYSMNEKNGYFFIAATTETDSGKDINTLYILDEKVAQVSKVENFAKNESIKAVRYIGDYAYVITYEQTDPLFVIDLSDVYSPQIKGSVKIDGFSTSLIPVDENTLLGVGNNVDDLVQDGTKFVLFDVSNPEEPKVIDELAFVDVDSQAQCNIKAITLFDNKVAIPTYNKGILLIDYSNNKLEEINNFDADNGYLRVVQINDYLYGVTDGYKADITPFRM